MDPGRDRPVALVGLHALPGRRSGIGLFGLLLACASAVASASYVVFALAYVAYKAFFSTDRAVPPPNLIFPEAAFDRVGDAFLAGGLLLLGAAVVRVPAPRAWSVLPVILCVLTLLSFLLQTSLGPAWFCGRGRRATRRGAPRPAFGRATAAPGLHNVPRRLSDRLGER